MRVGGDIQSVSRDERASTSSPLAISGIMHGSPVSDDSSLHSDSGIMNKCIGIVNNMRSKHLDNALYSQCLSAMCTLAKDPSLHIAGLGRRVLSIIGIEQVVAKSIKSSAGSTSPGESITSPINSLARLARSSSWFDVNAGKPHSIRGFMLSLSEFHTAYHSDIGPPTVSPPRPSYLATGMRRVYSLEFRPHLMSSPDSGLADPLLVPEDSEDVISKRDETEKHALDHISKYQHNFESGIKTALMQPFSPVVAADDSEHIRVWNYEDAAILNSYSNHEFLDKGVSKLCLINELDNSLLLAVSSDGSIRIWKDYSVRSKQKLLTAFSSIQGHKHSVQCVKAVVDWQQRSGYLIVSASQTGDIQFLDVRRHRDAYLTIAARRGSLTSLAVHRHAPLIASGSARQLIKLFNREGEQLGTIRYPNLHGT
ncbi:hypothetical protein AgCh_035976 [Apium graveolens]